ncbi:MAG TPA: GWxTD domain-containing protein [Verrucomicrobiae bacterium]|nr:GWxTD domain-containing protein [Verrucomicrobiae bacterium]
MGVLYAIRRFRHAPRIAGTAVLLVLGLLSLAAVPPAHAQKQKKAKKPGLDKSYNEWLDRDVAYIVTSDERKEFLKLTTNETRDKFIEDFWEIRNPNPGSPENTYKDEIYRRIAFADANFGSGANEEGWRTDRGRAYITLGPPQQKEVHYAASNMFPFEVWFYSYSHPSLPPAFYIMFYKHEGFGDFRFYSPFVDGPDKLMSGTEYINDYQGSIQAIQESVGPLVAQLSQSLIPGEPVDPSQGRPGLSSDAMLATVKGLANNPFTREEINQKRALYGVVSARLMIPGQNLDVATLPLRDARGVTRVDYAMRFREPSDITLEAVSEGHYAYNLQAQVRVYDAEKNNRLIFSQDQNVHGTMDQQEFNDMKGRHVGYEGTLPLPPGKFHIEFILTDWKNKKALQADKNVTVPEIDPAGVTIAGVLPFSAVRAADPATQDIAPFTLGGLTFTPIGTNPLTYTEDETVKIAYQIWARPQDPANYAGQKMTVEYVVGRPALAFPPAVVSEELEKTQFDPSGSLVNGKQLPPRDRPPGAYLLSVAIDQPGTLQRASSSLPFSVLPAGERSDVWDFTAPTLEKDVETGVVDRERGLCLLEQGKTDEARQWFRRALVRNHDDEISRARLVEAYYNRQDYAAIQSLYKDAGVSDNSDSGTILRIAESLDKTNATSDAIALVESSLTSRGGDGDLYMALAGYYRKAGDAKRAADAEAKGKALLSSPAAR